MSDTTTQTAAAPTPSEVTDSLGRKLTITKLDALKELDLIEAAGPNSANARWMTMATLTATVTAIDGQPRPWPSNRETIRAAVKVVGSEGIAAIVKALAGDEAAEGATPGEAEPAAA